MRGNLRWVKYRIKTLWNCLTTAHYLLLYKVVYSPTPIDAGVGCSRTLIGTWKYSFEPLSSITQRFFCAISRSIFWMSAIFIFLLKNLMVLTTSMLGPKRSILLGIRNANWLYTKLLTVKIGDWAEGGSSSVADGKNCVARLKWHCLRGPSVNIFWEWEYINFDELDKNK